jgi:uncharacterized protein (TIGR02147 family)
MNTEAPFYRTYLKVELTRRIELNPRYSLRAFSKNLNVNFGGLSFILSSKRPMSFKMGLKIVDHLDITPDDRRAFLESIIAEQRSRGLKRLDPRVRREKLTDDITRVRQLDLAYFRMLADWYHSAILEMIYLKNFRPDPKWIASELGIQEIEAKHTLERIIELGFFEKSADKIVRRDPFISTADKSLTTAALKKKQKKFREMAIRSIDADPIAERSMTSVTMCADPDLLEEAKRRISEFNKQLCAFLESGKNRRRVYVMEVSLFPVQKSPDKLAGENDENPTSTTNH